MKKLLLYYEEHAEELAEKWEKADKMPKFLKKALDADFFFYPKIREFKDRVADLKYERLAEKRRLEREEAKEARKNKFIAIYKEPDWQEMIAKGTFEQYLRDWERTKKQSEETLEMYRRKAAKDRINRILRITRPILSWCTYILGSVIVVTIFYYLGIGGIKLHHLIAKIPHKTWVGIGNGTLFITKWIGIIGGVACLVVGIVMGLMYLLKGVRKPNIEIEWGWLDYVADFFIFIGAIIVAPFIFIWKKIICPSALWVGNAIVFVIQMAKNNCPAIKWED